MTTISNSRKTVNRRERVGGAIYVLFFFALGVSVALVLLLRDGDVSRVFAKKDAIEMKMQRQQNFNSLQSTTADMCDLLVSKIEAYDPAVNAVYEKNDIQYVINELRREYENNSGDKRYLVFLHMSDFYQMWFNDKQYLWSLNANLSYVSSNLDDCELGLEKKQDELKDK
jgi:hypothetical protein